MPAWTEPRRIRCDGTDTLDDRIFVNAESRQVLPVHDRLCTLVARGIQEDPIGSAWPVRHCLVLEYPLPWAPELIESPGFPEGLLHVVKEARKAGEYPVLGVAPDMDYSRPGGLGRSRGEWVPSMVVWLRW